MDGKDEVIEIIEKWKKEIKEMNSQTKSSNPRYFSELKKKKKLMTPDEDMARINPFISHSEDIFRINCAYCSAAYDLRRRGYDVEADDYHEGATELDEVEPDIFEIYSWWTHSNLLLTRATNTAIKQAAFDQRYPGYKYFETAEYAVSDIRDSIIFGSNGSRGQMSFIWTGGKAHSVVYEINYGQLILRDCQHNRKVKFEEFANKAKRIYFFRTDNEEPTNKILNCIKNKSSDSVFISDLNPLDSLIKRFKEKGFKVAYYDSNNLRVNLKNRKDIYLVVNAKGEFSIKNIMKENYGL